MNHTYVDHFKCCYFPTPYGYGFKILEDFNSLNPSAYCKIEQKFRETFAVIRVDNIFQP